MPAARNLLAGLAVLGLLNGCAGSPGLSGIRPVGGVAVGQTSVAAGNALVGRGQYGLAVAAYRRVLRLDPSNSQALEGLAISYELLGRADLADRYYQEALALAPRNPRIYQNFAAFLKAQKRHADAEQLMADMRIALPDAPGEAPPVVTVAVEQAAPPIMAGPVVMAVPSAEPDVRLIRQSERATLVVTMPRTEAEPAARIVAPASATALRPPRVINAVGRRGVARQTVALLARNGFAGAETGDAAFKLKRSRILVPADKRELAERLSRSLPFKVRIEESARVDRVQILIGEDALAALMGPVAHDGAAGLHSGRGDACSVPARTSVRERGLAGHRGGDPRRAAGSGRGDAGPSARSGRPGGDRGDSGRSGAVRTRHRRLAGSDAHFRSASRREV